MIRNLTARAGVIACLGLAACSTPKDAQQLSQKTVEYGCGPGADQPLSVQYTFQGDEPLAAKVIYQNQAVDLTRATTSNADMVRSEEHTSDLQSLMRNSYAVFCLTKKQ